MSRNEVIQSVDQKEIVVCVIVNGKKYIVLDFCGGVIGLTLPWLITWSWRPTGQPWLAVVCSIALY
jgi:hypothetical protein